MRQIPLLFCLTALCLPMLAVGAPKPSGKASATPAPASTPPASAAAKSSSEVGSSELQESGQDSLPEAARTAAKRAIGEFNKGDLAAARRDFEEVLKTAPDNVPTLINLGLLAYRQKGYDEAAQLLTRAVRLAPEAGVGWLILGMVYYDQDKLDHALAALAQAVLLEPKDARAHHFLGVTIGKKGWYLGAEDEMRKAIELKPDYAEAHFNLAVFYLQRNPPAVELARRHYQKALELGAAPDSQVEKSIGSPKD